MLLSYGTGTPAARAVGATVARARGSLSKRWGLGARLKLLPVTAYKIATLRPPFSDELQSLVSGRSYRQLAVPALWWVGVGYGAAPPSAK